MKKDTIEKLKYDDKFPTDHITKIYMNQFEMAKKINEIIDYLDKLKRKLRQEDNPNL